MRHCHGEQLQGSGQNPPLKGEVSRNWQGETLADFYTQIQTTMPATKPGSLQPEEVSQLIAYILSVNSYPAGTAELPHTVDELKAIQFDLPPKGAQ